MASSILTDVSIDAASPAKRLRRQAAAVRVHFTWWGVHRTLTAQQKEDLGDACGADVRLLTAGKKLIDSRHEAFRRLTSIRHRTVQYWKALTLPYVEPGMRLIRQSNIEGFDHAMTGFRGELTEAEAELNAAFDQIKSDARQSLGRLFNPNDYPVEVHGLFLVDWDFPSVEPPSYLMRLSPDVYQQEQERVAQRFEQAVILAEQAFTGELAKLVSHLTERLSGNGGDGSPKVFRDSVVSNLVEFFERFKTLNVRSNAQLEELVEQAQEAVQGIKPQELRDSASLRQHVAMELSRVQESLDGMLVERPRRRILRMNPSANGGSHATADRSSGADSLPL